MLLRLLLLPLHAVQGWSDPPNLRHPSAGHPSDSLPACSQPSNENLQIRVAMQAMPMYALLPTVTDFIVEKEWTLAYPRVDDVGLLWYIVYFVAYMTLVEFGVYWMHRLLHEIRPLYNLLHCYHHIYNKQHTLSPFAGVCLQLSERRS